MTGFMFVRFGFFLGIPDFTKIKIHVCIIKKKNAGVIYLCFITVYNSMTRTHMHNDLMFVRTKLFESGCINII